MKCRYGVHKSIEYCLGNGFELSPDSIVIAVCWYTILVGYDVIQRKRRHLTCHLGSAILDFTIFLRGREISEVITTSNQNANEIYKFVNYCNLMNNSGKNTELCQKSWFLAKRTWSFWLPWRRPKWWRHNRPIKISPEDEWKCSEALEPITHSCRILSRFL